MRSGLNCINYVAIDSETKKIVYITETTKNQKFVCPECGKKMVLCAKDSEHVSPYFKHVAKTQCQGGTGESLIHRVCKEVVLDMTEITLPEVKANVMNKSLTIDNPRLFKILSCKAEINIKSGDKLLRPDVMLNVDGEDINHIIIEFKNTNKVSTLKKDYLRKLKNTVAIEVNIKPLLKLGYFPDRQEIINHIQCGCNITYLYHKTLEEVMKRYKNSLFTVSSDKHLCPLTDYTVTVDMKRCEKCSCYLGKDKGLMQCTGIGCYTKPKQLLSDTTVEERRDLYVDIPVDENKEFRLTNKRCECCGEPLRIGVGIRGVTFNGLLERVPLDNEYLYYVCVNDRCNRSYSAPIKCRNTEKIVPKYRLDTDGKPVLGENGIPIFVTVNGKKQYTCCGGYAKALIKNSKGKNGVAGHDYGARFIGCSATEKDIANLPVGQLKSCDASITLFDNEEDFKRGIWSEEIRAVGGLDEFFDNYEKAMKKVKKVREKRK